MTINELIEKLNEFKKTVSGNSAVYVKQEAYYVGNEPELFDACLALDKDGNVIIDIDY